MFRLMLILSLGCLALCHNPEAGKKMKGFMMKKYAKIKECKDFMGENIEYKIPNCPAEVSKCFEDSHKKAMKCIIHEKREWRKLGKTAKQCQKSNKKEHIEWFRLSCAWHGNVKKCMNGDEPDMTKYPNIEKHDHSAAEGHPKHHLKHMKAQTCWKDVFDTTENCNKKAKKDCPNYNICAGLETAPDGNEKMKKWYKIAEHGRWTKHQQTEKIHKAMKKCMEDANAASTSEE